MNAPIPGGPNSSDPSIRRQRAVEQIAEVSLWTPADWRRLIDASHTGRTVDDLLDPVAYPRIDGAFLQLGPECFTGDGAEQPQNVIMWRGAAYVRTSENAGSPRTWTGEAQAAFDQALIAAGDQSRLPEPDFWVQRAQVAAAIASAEQARVGNLIAWKQLRQSAPTSALPGGGDAIADEIEATLGIAAPTAAPVEPALTAEELGVIVDGLSQIIDGNIAEVAWTDQERTLADRLRLRLAGGSPAS